MVPNRSILLVTVPSLALILGFVWLRRKKSGVHCDTGGNNNNKSRLKQEDTAEINSSKVTTTNNCDSKTNNKIKNSCLVTETSTATTTTTQDLKRSQSLPCSNSLLSSSSSSDSIDKESGKSAPIDIAPNPRSPPKKLTEKQIDSQILKLKLEESDYKNLRSIEERTEENFSTDSPVDLPGSVERRRFSISPNNHHKEEPVIIKASMTAKVSPKGSFVEISIDGERDSANPSPDLEDTNGNVNNVEDKEVEEMIPPQEEVVMMNNEPIASPPLSLCSVRSGDSGKGSSPPHSEGGALTSVYDFIVPIHLVNRLIGKKGSYVMRVKARSGVNMVINRHPSSKKFKICSLEGTQKEIDAALKFLRQDLPLQRYPEVTFERVFLAEPNCVVSLPAIDPSCLQLQLIEGINNDVVISAVISGGQVFLQQPLHPSYPQLNMLQQCMNQSYSCIDAPCLAEVIESAICAAPVHTEDGNVNWFRVQVVSHNPQTDSALVKYLDYGGYMSVCAKDLRQIRTDFMTVPFQAIEVLLSNIKPSGEEWLPEASEVMFSLSNGIVLQAQIAGYSHDGYPEVYLYACFAKDNVVFINQELVARKLADWVPSEIATA